MTNLLLQTMSAFCDASLNPALWPDAMAALADAADADTAFTAEHTTGGDVGRITHSWGVDTKLLVTYPEAAVPLSQWLHEAKVVGSPPRVWDGEDIVIDGRPLGRSSFGSDWLQAQNLHYVLIGIAADADGEVDVVVLGRSRRRGRFSAEAAARLADLLPHLHRRLAASGAAQLAKTVQGAAATALRGVPLGVALIRADGGVLFANTTANAVINDGDILSLSNGALSLGQPGRRGRFRELLTRIAGMVKDGEQVSPRAIAVPRPSRQRPVSLLIWPLPDATEVGPDEPVAVVFIGDPEHRGEIDPMRLCDLYGLSRAEARVAALLAQGHRLDETAQILGVAYETVRKHLKQIFSKTGTDRQAELVRMLVGGPAAVLNMPL